MEPIVIRASVLALALSTGCVGGAVVFEPPSDGGPPAPCARTNVEPRFWEQFGANVASPEGVPGICLPPGSLAVDAAGQVDCRIVERLPVSGAMTTCDGLPGRIALGFDMVDGMPRAVCEIAQWTDATAIGWRYVDIAAADRPEHIDTQCGPRSAIDFEAVGPVGFVAGAVVDFSCAPSAPGYANSLGAPCPVADPYHCAAVPGTFPDHVELTCDPVTHQCNLECESDADCEAAGLTGERCASHGFCVPPTCGG